MVLFTFQTTRAWYVTSHWQTTPGLRLMMPSTQKSQACSQTTDNRNISWQALGQWLDYKIICTTRNWYLILILWWNAVDLFFYPTMQQYTSLLLKRISSFLNHSFAQQYGLNMMLKSDDGLVLLARSMVPSYPSMMADVVKVVAAVCLVK